jgi:hypothetical protein
MTTTASTGDGTPGTAYNFNWQSASNDQVMMSTCSYWGDDGGRLGPMRSAEDCGSLCAATPKCNNFAWWGNGCYLKMPGITHHPALSAIVSPKYPIGQCGCVVNRKSIGPWTTDGQLSVASNCSWTGGSYSTLSPVDLNTCKSYCAFHSSRTLQSFPIFWNCLYSEICRFRYPIPISSNVSAVT